MRLVADSDEAADSGWPEHLAGCLCVQLGCCGPAQPATTASYVSPPKAGPRCRLLRAVISPVLLWTTSPSPNRSPGTGRQAGSDGQSELKGLQLSFCPLGAAESHGTSEPYSRLRFDARGPNHSSVSFGGRKGLLLASRHSFPQIPEQDWRNLTVLIALIKDNSCLSIGRTAGAHRPLEYSL